VEEALRRVAGVSEALVNLMDESASVAAEDDTVSEHLLLSAVRATGYEAEVVKTAAELAEHLGSVAAHREKIRRHRRALVQALALALPIVALEYLRPILWGPTVDNQMSCRLLQLVLLVALGASPAGWPILLGGLRALWHRTGNMDLLITMGVAVAFVGSLYGMFVARANELIHLHAAAMILGIVCLGRYLEAKAKGRASAAMTALAGRAPKTALLRRDGKLVSVPVEQIGVGDVVNVPTHATIAVDGEVLEGSATVDESLMTGEAMPVARQAGDRVLGGTVITEGLLTLRATSVGSRSALGRIVQLVARAQAGRTPAQRLADRVAAVFAPVVLCVAAAAFLGWLVIGGRAALPDAIRSAVAVLVVACPCALGLATPTVVMVASGMAALRGILVRDAAMLEDMGRLDLVVWDKTGTLTSGMPSVRSVATLGNSDEESLLRLAAGAEQLSPHPIAQAIVAQARRAEIDLPEPASFVSIPGGGVSAVVDGRQVLIGSLRFLQTRSVDVEPLEKAAQALRRQGDTVVAVAAEGEPLGVMTLTDAIRPSSAAAVRRLRDLGIRSELLTGDEEGVAREVAGPVGIDELRAGVDPAGKVGRIEELKRRGQRVAMVGDGINDAAALATADVGIAFATGADVAGEAAGINLIGSTPHLVADAVELARVSLRIIRQNLFWAFFYNVLMIPLAVAGILPPVAAAGAMTLSSLTVVLNALRLPRVLKWSSPRRAAS
jgi:Cu+-exporting ATPase